FRQAARTGDSDLITLTYRSAGDGTRKTAKIEMRTIDPLDKEAKWPISTILRDLDCLEIIEQRGATIPGRVCARLRNIVAVARRNRNGRDRIKIQRGGNAHEIGADLLKTGFVEANQINLVDGKNYMFDACQRDNCGVPARLGQDTLARVHEQ